MGAHLLPPGVGGSVISERQEDGRWRVHLWVQFDFFLYNNEGYQQGDELEDVDVDFFSRNTSAQFFAEGQEAPDLEAWDLDGDCL